MSHQQLQRSVVLLLKSAASDDENRDKADPYIDALAEENFDAHCVTALNFSYINADSVVSCLNNANEYSCLVLASAKSVEAIRRAISQSEWMERTGPLWKNKRTYVVGSATERAAQGLNLDTYGSQSGNSEALADIIIQDRNDGLISIDDGPALLLSSSIKLELLPTKIRAEGIRVRCVDAYDTIPSQSLDADLLTFHQSKGYPRCIVFYSPSGVRAALPIMKARDWPLRDIYMIAIGPTTEEELRLHGVQHVYTADQPKPVSVAQTCTKALHQSAASQ